MSHHFSPKAQAFELFEFELFDVELVGETRPQRLEYPIS